MKFYFVWLAFHTFNAGISDTVRAPDGDTFDWGQYFKARRRFLGEKNRQPYIWGLNEVGQVGSPKHELVPNDEMKRQRADDFEQTEQGKDIIEPLKRKAALDSVLDGESVSVTLALDLLTKGIIFLPMQEALQKVPNLVLPYLGSVVPLKDNFCSIINDEVFTDGSFIYVPKHAKPPVSLSTFFKIKKRLAGQFERTLIVVEPYAYVSYIEGCVAPNYDEKQMHAAVVELIAHENAQIRWRLVPPTHGSTLQRF
eukprot:Filipodium_phascolosomae@DN4986_c0_g1_i1.p1